MQQQDEYELYGTSEVALYDRYASTIFTYIRQRTTSREEAEDLTVDVFTAALEHDNLHELTDTAKLAWLRRVAHNKLVDGYRHSTRHPIISLEQGEMILHNDKSATPEQLALQQEEYRQLYKALSTLSTLQQQLLRLRYGDGLRFAEIAVMLDKREEAVRKLLSRTLTTLRQQLQATRRK